MAQMKRTASWLDLPAAGMFCGHSQRSDHLISDRLALLSAA